MIVYASVVWCRRATILSAESTLNRIQRLACISFTGAMRTTPQRALEVLLNLPPLSCIVMAEAKQSAWILRINKLWSVRTVKGGHSNVWVHGPRSIVLDMPCDKIPTRFHFNRPFRSIVRNKDSGTDNVITEQMLASNCWFTDGSVMNGKAGAGIYCNNPATSIAIGILFNFPSRDLRSTDLREDHTVKQIYRKISAFARTARQPSKRCLRYVLTPE